MNSVIDMSAGPIVRRDRPATEITALPEATPMHMLAIAVQQGADIAKIEKLMELQERWEKNQARKAYVAAMAAFKANPPTIVKNKHVSYPLKTGGRTEYNHATHDEVTTKIIMAMSPHGLSHNWSVRQADGMVFVKCTVTHELGYSESAELFGPPDTSGTKSPIQAIASTVTLLQRYTLISVTGLTSEEIASAESDGRAERPQEPPPEGYEVWAADLAAVVDEGRERLLEVWKKSPMPMRAYMTKHEAEKWSTMKKASEQVPA